MMQKKRITITLPPDLILAADRLAERLDRSRSWVVAEALRAHLAPDYEATASLTAVDAAEAPSTTYAPAEVAQARRAHLRAEAALPPEERLRRAEELGRLAHLVHPRGPRKVIIIFDSYEDFYEWRKSRLIGA